MPSLISLSEDGKREIFPLGKATLLVGRGEDSEIHVTEESVSSNHASVIFEGENFWIRDNGSTNGTFVNGEIVQRCILKHLDIVRFGNVTFIVDLNDDYSDVGQATPRVPELKAKSRLVLEEERSSAQGAPRPYRVVVGVKALSSSKKPGKELPGVDVKMVLTKPVVRPRSWSGSVSVKHAGPDGLALFSLICGMIGFIAFLPAIVLGHLAGDGNPATRRFRRTGLGLGYGFLAIWLLVIVWWLQRPKAATPSDFASKSIASVPTPALLQPPSVVDAMALLRGPMTWVPSPELVDAILSPATGAEMFSLPAVHGPNVDRMSALQEFRSTWKNGLVLFEAQILHSETSLQSPGVVQMVLEDVTTNPTFQEYNSTVVPEKKDVVGPFYVPGLENGLYFRRNPRLASRIPKFNEERFPWRMGERGVRWTEEGRFDQRYDLQQLRWICVLRPSAARAPLRIQTLEGGLLNDTPVEYNLPYYPAEILVEIFYMQDAQIPVTWRFNESLFKPDEMRVAKAMLDKNFKFIQSMRLASKNEIPLAFSLMR